MVIKEENIELELLDECFTIHKSYRKQKYLIGGVSKELFEIEEYTKVPDLEDEYWLDVLGWRGYMVSNLGRVKSCYLTHESLLKKQKNENGYETVVLYNNNYKKKLLVHRIVADNFLLNPEDKPTVDHINRKRDDNRLCNLRWATHKEQGENKSEYTRPTKVVGKDIRTGNIKIVFDSYADGERFGFNPKAISSNVNGHTESYKGLKFTAV